MIQQTTSCCSLIEIGAFWESFHSKEEILKQIKSYIQEYLDDGDDVPLAYFATTKESSNPRDIQNLAAAALREIGFKPKKFHSRHDIGRKKTMTHWFLDGIPKDLRPWYRKEKARINKERNNDHW